MKKITLFIVTAFLILNAQAQYDETLWQVLDGTTNVTAITGLNPSHGYVRDAMAKNNNENYNNAYVLTWEGDVLKVNYTNPGGDNWVDFQFSTIQWVGSTGNPFTKSTTGVNQNSDIAKGYSVDFTNPTNRIISFKVQTESELNLSLNLIDINGKMSNGASPKITIYTTAGGVNTSDDSKWRTVTISWGGDVLADAEVQTVIDMYSQEWWNISNIDLRNASTELLLSKIIGLSITIDDGNQGIDGEIKNIYFKDLNFGIENTVQYSEQASLSLSKSSMTLLGNQNSSDVLDIQTSLDWNIVANDSWIHVNQNSGTGNSTITVTSDENIGTYRTGTITVSANGITSKTITINQLPLNSELSVSTNAVTLPYIANSQTIQVTSLYNSWTASALNSWLTVTPTTNLVDGVTDLILTAQKNTTNTNRSTQVTIAGEFGVTKIITVTQQFDALANAEPWTVVDSTTQVQSISGLHNISLTIDNSNTYDYSWLYDILKIDFTNNLSPLNWSEINFSLINWEGNTGNKFIKDTLGNVQPHDIAKGYSVDFTQDNNRTITLKYQASHPMELRADIRDINGKTSNAFSPRANLVSTLEGINLEDDSKWQEISFSWNEASMGAYGITDYYSKTWWDVYNQNYYYSNELDKSKIIGVSFIIDDSDKGNIGDKKSLFIKDIKIGNATNPIIYNSPELLGVLKSTVTIEDTLNSLETFVIKSNTDWVISCAEPWLTISQNSGNGDTLITVTANENNIGVSRNATITISNANLPSQELVVIQKSNLSKTINLTQAGTLYSSLTHEEIQNISNLTITGNIDARDFKIMRDSMPSLKDINLAQSIIIAYNGTEGTSNDIYYSANTVPDSAFRLATKINSIVLPISIIGIGSHAFQNCENIKSIFIPSGVTTINEYTFQNCYKLDSINLPNTISLIGMMAFDYCNNLKSIDFHENLKSIGILAFGGCTSLSTITIPKSTESIKPSAFSGCSGITKIYVNSTSPIDLSSSSNVFLDINKSTCILTVPYGTKSLYQNANQWKDFLNIVEMNYFRIIEPEKSIPADSNYQVSFTVNSSIPWTAVSSDLWLHMNIETINGNLVIVINAEANQLSTNRIGHITVSAAGFDDIILTITQNAIITKIIDLPTAGTLFTSLTQEELKTVSNLTITGNIDARDFKIMRDSMPNLTNINIENSIIVFYSGTEGTGGNNIIDYNENVIPKNAFANSNKLVNILLPNSVLKIDTSAFSLCTHLSDFEFPINVQIISSAAFQSCYNLNDTLLLPSSLKFVGSGAFFDCRKIEYLFLNEGLEIIGISAFSKLINVYGLLRIPSSVTSLGKYAFSDLKNIDSVEFNEGLKTIDEGCFAGCINLQTVSIPSSVTTINKTAFQNLGNLTTVELHEGLQVIGEYAFAWNRKLEGSITIPASVTTINSYAFAGDSLLTAIYVNHTTPLDLSASSNVFYQINKSKCILYVPYGTKSLYQVANQWKDFLNIVEINPLEVSQNFVIVGSNAGSSINVDIISSVTWTVNSNVSWLSLNYTNMQGDAQLIISTLSTTNAVRSGIITISSNGLTDRIIVVTQVASSEMAFSVTAGNLQNQISDEVKNTVTSLTLTGTIDARDIYFIRDSLPNLEILDLSNVTILEYTGEIDSTLLLKYSELFSANTIPRKAFKNKTSLQEIYLPASIEAIGDEAFYGCINLKVFGLKTTNPANITVSPTALEGINMLICKLLVPKGSESLYATANDWKNFETIEAETNIETTKNSECVAIYPNPVKESFQIMGLQNEATITVFDIAGNQILQQKTQPKQQIDCSNIISGIYIVTVIEANKITKLQMIKK